MTGSPVRFLLGFILCSSLFLGGCGTYRNITAYFNTFYNASKLFEDAVAEANRAPQLARDSNYFAPYKISQGTVLKFEKVIEKGSKLIQFHGESDYVEDAIVMIGKSYLYQNETESATSKFRELMENFPASDRRYEAKLWYAKALYQGNNDQEALIAANELTAERGQDTEIEDDVLLEASMLEARIYEDRGEYEQAAGTLSGIEGLDGSAELKTIALYLLGNVHEKTGDYYAAARAYASVQEYSPTPAMRFNARLKQGVMLSRAGESELALETFDEILAWPLKREESALVDYEIATAYWEKGDSASAFTLYAIIDSTYRKTDASARANYIRAEIMRTDYKDYAAAKKYYEMANKEFPNSPVSPQAYRRFQTLDHYFRTHAALAKDDSLFLTVIHRDSTSATEPALAGPEQTPPGGGEEGDIAMSPPDDTPVVDPGDDAPPDPRNLARMVAGENLSMRAIRLRPRHLVVQLMDARGGPGTAAVGPSNGQGTGEGDADLTGQPGGDRKRKTPASLVTTRKTTHTPEQISARLAANKYELGGIHFLDLEQADSALFWYSAVVNDHPGSPLVAKAIYAMSEVHRSREEQVIVDSLHDILIEQFTETEYALQVMKNRGLDTIAVAEDPLAVRYREAEELLVKEETDEALTKFKTIYADAKDTLIAPMAAYTVAWIFENTVLHLDSAEVWYKKVIRDYPKSVYAGVAVPKVAVKEDTSKLEQFVKIREIKPIPKPVKRGFGLVRKEGQPGGVVPPMQDPFRQSQGRGTRNLNIGDDESDDEEYDEEDLEEEEEEDEEDPDDEEEDDDPGDGYRSGTGSSNPDTGAS
jgi:tetratricopeptide (TPR) repeat protein